MLNHIGLCLYTHYDDYSWQPVITPASCVSSELASQEGHVQCTAACVKMRCLYVRTADYVPQLEAFPLNVTQVLCLSISKSSLHYSVSLPLSLQGCWV